MSSETSQHLGDELLGGDEDDIVEREPDSKEAVAGAQAQKGETRSSETISFLRLSC